MLFAPGAPREHFEGMAKLGDMADAERREWFIRNDNFVIEEPTLRSRDGGDVEPQEMHPPNRLR